MKISIITPTLNSEKSIAFTLNSVFNQTFKNFEHIILDGGSTDNTLNIIKEYEDKIDYWCSKKDSGIYDAFNNGMKLAKGDYIGFLNSDDVYTHNALEILNTYIKKNPSIDFFLNISLGSVIISLKAI